MPFGSRPLLSDSADIEDQTRDAQDETQEDDRNDCAIERTESRLFGTVGRNDRGAYDITAFALAISDFGHSRFASMAWAILPPPGEGLKIGPNDLIWNEES
jgi:hypothetical protein